MKRFVKHMLLLSGVAAVTGAAAAVSTVITNTLVGEAIDRSEPRLMVRAKRRIAGSMPQDTFLRILDAYGSKLESAPTEAVTAYGTDGAKLAGHWYPVENAKRIILAMHGWRSSWFRDFGVITDFWRECGCSILFAEQRAQGQSEGEHMGFGMTERYDCLEWIKWIGKNIGTDLPLYLAGVSMGATTVLMTAGFELPQFVHGIMADSGFTSPNAIWRHIAKNNLHLSYKVRARQIETLCRAKIHVRSDDYSTLEAMQSGKTPVLFAHGAADTFVPVEMTYENYYVCTAPKRIYIVPGANHAMGYLIDPTGYQNATRAFWADFDGKPGGKL